MSQNNDGIIINPEVIISTVQCLGGMSLNVQGHWSWICEDAVEWRKMQVILPNILSFSATLKEE